MDTSKKQRKEEKECVLSLVILIKISQVVSAMPAYRGSNSQTGVRACGDRGDFADRQYYSAELQFANKL